MRLVPLEYTGRWGATTLGHDDTLQLQLLIGMLAGLQESIRPRASRCVAIPAISKSQKAFRSGAYMPPPTQFSLARRTQKPLLPLLDEAHQGKLPASSRILESRRLGRASMSLAALHDVIASLAATVCASLISDNASYSPACKLLSPCAPSARSWRLEAPLLSQSQGAQSGRS